MSYSCNQADLNFLQEVEFAGLLTVLSSFGNNCILLGSDDYISYVSLI